MPPSTNKRIVLYRFGRSPVSGIVSPADYLRENHLEMITHQGTLERLAYPEVKAVCFVSEDGQCNLFEGNAYFETRPRMEGLWTRFFLKDGDQLEGILSHNLLDWPEQGYSFTPPRAGPGRQRVFLPRLAVSATELLGVVGAASRTPVAKKRAHDPHAKQIPMFET